MVQAKDLLSLTISGVADVAVLGLNGEVVRVGEPGLTVTDADRIDCYPPTSGG